LVLLAAIAAGALRLHAWSARHEEFLSVGSSLYPFFSHYSSDFKSMSKSLLASSYSAGAKVNFFSYPADAGTVDGAGTISYQPLPEGMRPAEPEQIRHYFENIAK